VPDAEQVLDVEQDGAAHEISRKELPWSRPHEHAKVRKTGFHVRITQHKHDRPHR
jgi:hypothetical protein